MRISLDSKDGRDLLDDVAALQEETNRVCTALLRDALRDGFSADTYDVERLLANVRDVAERVQGSLDCLPS